MRSTYSSPARRYNRILRKFCPKNPKPSRKRKMVMSARTTMAMSALLPKKALMKSSARQRRAGSGISIGDGAATSVILQSCRFREGGGKFRNVTITLQNAGESLTIYPAYGRDGRSGRAEERIPLICRAIRQNDANCRTLAQGAVGFYPATMELHYVFDDR